MNISEFIPSMGTFLSPLSISSLFEAQQNLFGCNQNNHFKATMTPPNDNDEQNGFGLLKEVRKCEIQKTMQISKMNLLQGKIDKKSLIVPL